MATLTFRGVTATSRYMMGSTMVAAATCGMIYAISALWVKSNFESSSGREFEACKKPTAVVCGPGNTEIIELRVCGGAGGILPRNQGR